MTIVKQKRPKIKTVFSRLPFGRWFLAPVSRPQVQPPAPTVRACWACGGSVIESHCTRCGAEVVPD